MSEVESILDLEVAAIYNWLRREAYCQVVAGGPTSYSIAETISHAPFVSGESANRQSGNRAIGQSPISTVQIKYLIAEEAGLMPAS